MTDHYPLRRLQSQGDVCLVEEQQESLVSLDDSESSYSNISSVIAGEQRGWIAEMVRSNRKHINIRFDSSSLFMTAIDNRPFLR